MRRLLVTLPILALTACASSDLPDLIVPSSRPSRRPRRRP